MKLARDITVIVCVVAVALAALYVAADYFGGQASHAEAVKYCMRWGIAEAMVLDGVIYCRAEMSISGGPSWMTVPQWKNEDYMEAQFDFFLVPTAEPAFTP